MDACSLSAIISGDTTSPLLSLSGPAKWQSASIAASVVLPLPRPILKTAVRTMRLPSLSVAKTARMNASARDEPEQACRRAAPITGRIQEGDNFGGTGEARVFPGMGPDDAGSRPREARLIVFRFGPARPTQRSLSSAFRRNDANISYKSRVTTIACRFSPATPALLPEKPRQPQNPAVYAGFQRVGDFLFCARNFFSLDPTINGSLWAIRGLKGNFFLISPPGGLRASRSS